MNGYLIFKKYKCCININYRFWYGYAIPDALLSSLLDPLEGLGMLNCGKLELGAIPDFQR